MKLAAIWIGLGLGTGGLDVCWITSLKAIDAKASDVIDKWIRQSNDDKTHHRDSGRSFRIRIRCIGSVWLDDDNDRMS